MKLSMRLLSCFPDIDFDHYRLHEKPEYRLRIKCQACGKMVWIARLKVFRPWKYMTGAEKRGAIKELRRWEEYLGPEFCDPKNFYYLYRFCPECWEIFEQSSAYWVEYCRWSDIIDERYRHRE